jgi:hypothetical protein
MMSFGVPGGKSAHRLCPFNKAFHAEVPSGSVWILAKENIYKHFL